MERVRLSKAEKAVLKELHRGNSNIPAGIDNFTYVDAVLSLRDKGMVTAHVDYNEVIDVKLTAKGHAYIITNPHLCNPINWSMLAAIGTIATAITTLLALFIACPIFAMYYQSTNN